MNITAHVSLFPASGSVLEGWLIDPDIPSYFNLTLGQFVNGTLGFDQYMVNPAVYKFFVVSQEPIGDTDPRPANVKYHSWWNGICSRARRYSSRK